MEFANLTPQRPYLLRAYYDWMIENDLTPHLMVDATLPGVRVPLEFVRDGQIVLNVAPRAVGNLDLGNEAVMFQARFGGRPHSVIVPIYAVVAIYARENGAGKMFEPDPAYEIDEDEELDFAEFDDEEAPSLSTVDSDDDDSDDDPEPPRPSGRPTLRVVK
uniref:ClpXP protease specificity-enhancing factor n=1 Tax=Thaumasiovibrio occultus TaxID=1891184 RepID=UPI000B3555A1|nr:ClpXP protease specificity-enhancing factor [Thaumasiovibrio occultus]